MQNTKNGDIQTAYYNSPVGWLKLSATDTALTGLSFLKGAPPYYAATTAEVANGPLRMAGKWLDEYFGGQKPSPATLPLDPSGSEFARRVYDYVKEIPYGTTTTYGAIAAKLDGGVGRMAPRAVGGAISRNPIAIIIPCHRVIGSDSKLRGFAGGLSVKGKLLGHEGLTVMGNMVFSPKTE